MLNRLESVLGQHRQPVVREGMPVFDGEDAGDVLANWFDTNPDRLRWRVLPGYEFIPPMEREALEGQFAELALGSRWPEGGCESLVPVFGATDTAAALVAFQTRDGTAGIAVADPQDLFMPLRPRFGSLVDLMNWVLAMWEHGGFVTEGPNDSPAWHPTYAVAVAAQV